ncbi:MAG TPA: rhamnose ABC transporter substrate-binding protein [Anaerolineaceae bacterium]|nr:rhamnose ABC transporter substrate-binding protein [Anaerolineaceae bacterium]
MKTRFGFSLMVVVLLLGIALSACGPQATAAPTQPPPPTSAPAAQPTTAPAATEPPAASGGGKVYALVPKNLGNPYFDTANKGAQEAAKELGVTVNYTGPATADATQQIQLLNSLIAQKVSGLAISADDADALVPTGKSAMDAGIPVVTWDSAIAAGGRTVHINQAEAQGIADVQIKMASDLAGAGGGKIAILSATSTAPNQNEWIKLMKETLKKPEYSKLNLVDTVYGDDEDTKSYNEAQGLFKKYPDLKVIIAPTTVGIAASARAVQDANLVGKVFVTGLGTPNQMRDYVKSGASPQFALWNPSDLGYLAVYTLDAIATGKIKGQPGDKFTAGKLGEYTVKDDGTVLLGLPTVFNKDNIDNFNF